MNEPVQPRSAPTFEPGDPARVPTAKFAWLAAVAALVIVAAGMLLWRAYYTPAVTLPPITAEPVPTAAPAAAVAPVAPVQIPLAPAGPVAGDPAASAARVVPQRSPASPAAPAAAPSAAVPAPAAPAAAVPADSPSPASTTR